MRRTRHNPVCSKEQRRRRAIAALSVLCLLGFIGTFLAEAIATQQNGWRTARGVILTREEETSWDINLEMYTQRYRYQVEYKTVDGERKTAEIMTETPYADSGDFVDIRYDPDDPASITFSGEQTNGDRMFLQVVRYVLLVLGLGGIFLIAYRRKKEQ